MGIVHDLRTLKRNLQAANRPAVSVASPMAPRPNHLEAVVWSELIDREYSPVTRADAMRVPALARARSLIVTSVARLPMQAIRGGEPLADQPRWIDRTNGTVSPYHRMLHTADDLLFYGWSLWAVVRDSEGAVIEADRVPMDMWEIDSSGEILVNSRPVSSDEVILIPGVHEGILAFGDETIRQARGLLASVERAASTPNAMVELHQTNDRPMKDEDIDALISRWVKARRGENQGVAFTSAGVEVKEHGAATEHLLIEGRNAVAVDIARLCGIPSAMIDATLNGTSLSYSNPESRMAELIVFGVSPFLGAIAGRLGMDDVCPRGVAIEFDTTEAVTPTGPFGPPDDGNQPGPLKPVAYKTDTQPVKEQE